MNNLVLFTRQNQLGRFKCDSCISRFKFPGEILNAFFDTQRRKFHFVTGNVDLSFVFLLSTGISHNITATVISTIIYTKQENDHGTPI